MDSRRKELFDQYWNFGNVEVQRLFILNCIHVVSPKVRVLRVGGKRDTPRKANNSFHFNVDGEEVRVCKQFFRNTLNISERTIRTVIEKKNKVAGVLLEPDNRGKHLSYLRMSKGLKDGVKKHIDSIPRIESHYLRAQTQREFIEGSKTIAGIYRDYAGKEEFVPPKKDQCETCVIYKNATDGEKIPLEEKYQIHLIEKDLSRGKKKRTSRIQN